MSELNSTNAWPFTEIPAEERLDINAIFGDSTDTANQGNPFEQLLPDGGADAACRLMA